MLLRLPLAPETAHDRHHRYREQGRPNPQQQQSGKGPQKTPEGAGPRWAGPRARREGRRQAGARFQLRKPPASRVAKPTNSTSTGTPVLARPPGAPAEGPLDPVELAAASKAAGPLPSPRIPLCPTELARLLLMEAADVITAGPVPMPDLTRPGPEVPGPVPGVPGCEAGVPGCEAGVPAGVQATDAPPPSAPAPCSPQLAALAPSAGEPPALLEPTAPERVPVAAAVEA